MHYLELFLMLVGAHYICDFVLQTDNIALGKNRNIEPVKLGVNWYYWMSAHAATHAFAVGWITGSFWLGFFEFVLHWLIDAGKCEKFYNFHMDQLFHAVCKLVIVGCAAVFLGY